MKKGISIFVTAIIILFSILVIVGTFKVINGNMFANDWFSACMVIVFAGAFLVTAVYCIKSMWIPLIILMGIVLQSCSYSKSNQQNLISTDCGMSWKQIAPGDAVPSGAGNPCFVRVVIPNYPLQGDMIFIANLAEHVRIKTHMDYNYVIDNGLAFIKEAKSIGRANSDPDNADAIESQFESAENRVIDKNIKDVAKNMFLKEDILDMDQNALETRLLAECNDRLKRYGVALDFITLVFEADEQTQEAIDVATAMRIYQSKGLSDIGKLIMQARAGATKISVENKVPSVEPTK